MRNKKQMALIVGLFFVMSTVGAFADKPPVSISTLNWFQMAPIGRTANIVLTVKVEKHEDNRDIEVRCDGLDGGIFASSGKSLGGDTERRTFDFAFNLTPATYRCDAVLKRMVGGKKKKFTSSIEVTVN